MLRRETAGDPNSAPGSEAWLEQGVALSATRERRGGQQRHDSTMAQAAGRGAIGTSPFAIWDHLGTRPSAVRDHAVLLYGSVRRLFMVQSSWWHRGRVDAVVPQ